MKQIYNFEAKHPPVLNENILKTMEEKRRIRMQTAIASAAGALMTVCLLLGAVLLYDSKPVLAVIVLLHICASLICGGMVFVVFLEKRRNELWQECR